MANLTGMPISSLPETTLQEGDQVVGYRAETGKAYRTDLADQIADLTEQVNQLNQSLTELSGECHVRWQPGSTFTKSEYGDIVVAIGSQVLYTIYFNVSGNTPRVVEMYKASGTSVSYTINEDNSVTFSTNNLIAISPN